MDTRTTGANVPADESAVDEAQILVTIVRYFVDELLDEPGMAPPGPDDDLLDSDLLDSVGAARLGAHLESSYRIELSPLDFTFENFATPRAIARLVLARHASRAAA